MKRTDERGAALLSVLLLVAVMAVIAATALDRLTLATRLAGAAASVDQARAFADAGEALVLRRAGDIATMGGWRATIRCPCPADARRGDCPTRPTVST